MIGENFSRIRDDMNWLFCLALLSEVCVALGDKNRAAGLIERLTPFADRFLVAGYGVTRWGSAARSLGLLNGAAGNPQVSVALLRQARELELQAGGTVWLGYVECDLARSLCRMGRSRDADEARRLAGSCAMRAREYSLTRLGRLAEEALSAAAMMDVR
jgi:hypothetical protein